MISSNQEKYNQLLCYSAKYLFLNSRLISQKNILSHS